MFQTFLNKNKVFIAGLIGAIAMTLQQFAGVQKIDWKVVGLALAVAIGGYLGRTLRGQKMSIVGLIGVAGTAIATEAATGNINWFQVLISFFIMIQFVVSPPPKDAGYEKTETIVEAKKEGAEITKGVNGIVI